MNHQPTLEAHYCVRITRRKSPTAKRVVLSICFLIAVLGSCSLCLSQTVVTPEAALTSYRNYLNSIYSISFDSKFMDFDSETSSDFTNAVSQNWKIDFENKRLWSTTRNVFDGESPNEYSEKLVTSSKKYEISADFSTSFAKRMTAYRTVPDDYWPQLTGFGYLSYPFGYLKDGRTYRHIPDMLHNVSVIETEDSLVELKCNEKEYEITILLNPSKGWMAERIEYTATGTSNNPERPDYCLYSVEKSDIYEGVWLPEQYRCKESHSAGKRKLPSNVRIVDGGLEVVAEDSEVGTNIVEEQAMTAVAEVNLSNIKITSFTEADFQVRASVPNGLEVGMQDARHLTYVWLDGNVVPLTNEAIIALGESKFLGGLGSPRFWSINLTVLLVVILLYLNARKRLKTRQS